MRCDYFFPYTVLDLVITVEPDGFMSLPANERVVYTGVALACVCVWRDVFRPVGWKMLQPMDRMGVVISYPAWGLWVVFLPVWVVLLFPVWVVYIPPLSLNLWGILRFFLHSKPRALADDFALLCVSVKMAGFISRIEIHANIQDYHFLEGLLQFWWNLFYQLLEFILWMFLIFSN